MRQQAERPGMYASREAPPAPAVQAAILDGQVIIGMTQAEVRASWGEPAAIHLVTHDRHSVWYTERFDEEWCFTDAFLKLGAPRASVLFKRGLVVEVQLRHWDDAISRRATPRIFAH